MRPIFTGFLYNIIIEENINTPKELLEYFSVSSAEDIIERSFKCYNLDINFNENDDILLNSISKIAGLDEARLFIYIKNNAPEFKSKYYKILNTFYNSFFIANEKNIADILSTKSKLHTQVLNSDPKYFLSTIGLGDYSNVTKKGYSLKLFVSYYTDVGVSYVVNNQVCYIQYGVSMDERFCKKVMSEKYKNLFKALSDNTRREIISLTSQRPWYNKELANHFGLTTATLSYHLNILLDLEILHFDPTDNYRYYYVTNKNQLKLLFKTLLSELID